MAINGGRLGRGLAAALMVVVLGGGGGVARATTYSNSYTVNPADFKCGFFAKSEICSSIIAFATPIASAPGDEYDTSVTFTTPLTVPGSKSADFAFAGLYTNSTKNGPAVPGPDSDTFYSAVKNYSSTSKLPPISGGPYSFSSLDQYTSIVGFCCSYGVPNPGFTLSGYSTALTITSNVPGESIFGQFVGFSVDLPTAPKDLGDFPGGTVDDPAILPSGEIGSIEGHIGDALSQQVYAFNWDGGLFDTVATIDPGAILPGQSFSFELLSLSGTVLKTGDLLTSVNGSSELESVLASGSYLVGLFTSAGADPDFKITFETPIVTAAAPEPSLWLMMISGVALLGGFLRRRRASSSTLDASCSYFESH